MVALLDPPRLRVQAGKLEAAVPSLPSGSQQPITRAHPQVILLLLFYRPHLPIPLFLKIKDRVL